MRLLECLNSANPRDGGTVESTRQRSLSLLSQGHDVELLTLDDTTSPWISQWPTTVHALGRGFSRFGYNPRVTPWLKARASDFDAIIVNGVWRYMGVGVRNGLPSGRPPYFVIPHSMLNPWFQRTVSLASIGKTATWQLIEWKVLRDARAVLFTCEEERRLANNAYTPYICNEDVVSLVGTAAPPVTEGTKSERLFSLYPHLRGKQLVLYLSRLHPMKGCDLLIKAFAQISVQESNLHLVIAGHSDGKFIGNLKDLAASLVSADRVTWAGRLSDDMKWATLQAASVFVLPSHCEAFPLALVEALGAGLPVLITDRVNIWPEVVKANAGFVDSDTVEGTHRSLGRWLRLSHEERQSMKSNALRCFGEHFESTMMGSRFVASLQRHGVANG